MHQSCGVLVLSVRRLHQYKLSQAVPFASILLKAGVVVGLVCATKLLYYASNLHLPERGVWYQRVCSRESMADGVRF